MLFGAPRAALARIRIHLRNFLVWYLSSWAGLYLLFVAVLLWNGVTLRRLLVIFPRIVRFTAATPANWLLPLIPYLLYLLTRSLVRTYREKGIRAFAGAFICRAFLPACLLVAGYKAQDWYVTDREPYLRDRSVENPLDRVRGLYEIDRKQRGVTFSARTRVTADQLEPLVRDNVEWITLVPYAFQEGAATPELRILTGPRGDWSGTDEGIRQITMLAKERGMHVMVKPQVWLGANGRGAWLSDIRQESEQGWNRWFESYRLFILHYAEIAARLRIDTLCIGTELHGTAKERPGDWRRLIGEIRRVYGGNLTYAANWMGELDDVTFWDALDYIGVQGYFPLSSEPEPTIAQCVDGWRKHIGALEETSRRFRKPVLFTEIGFKSTLDAAARPWEWPQQVAGILTRVSGRTQANCYEAFFLVVWDKEWFAGAHVWKWYADHPRSGGRKSIDFTPQNKPAETVIARGFGRLGNGPVP